MGKEKKQNSSVTRLKMDEKKNKGPSTRRRHKIDEKKKKRRRKIPSEKKEKRAVARHKTHEKEKKKRPPVDFSPGVDTPENCKATTSYLAEAVKHTNNKLKHVTEKAHHHARMAAQAKAASKVVASNTRSKSQFRRCVRELSKMRLRRR